MNNKQKLLALLDEEILEIFNNMFRSTEGQECRESCVKMWDSLDQRLESDKQAFVSIFDSGLYGTYRKIVSESRQLTLNLPQSEYIGWLKCLGMVGNSYFSRCINVQKGIKEVPQNPHHIAYNTIQTLFRLRNEAKDERSRKERHELLRSEYCSKIITDLELIYMKGFPKFRQLGYAFLERCHSCPVDRVE